MDESTLKKCINAAKTIDDMDREIKDIASFGDRIALGDFERIGVTFSITSPRKDKDVNSEIDGVRVIGPFSLSETIRRIRENCGSIQGDVESQSYSRDITDTMALVMLGSIISELNEIRKRQIDCLQNLTK